MDNNGWYDVKLPAAEKSPVGNSLISAGGERLSSTVAVVITEISHHDGGASTLLQ